MACDVRRPQVMEIEADIDTLKVLAPLMDTACYNKPAAK
jgi:hypothetical protein